MRLRLAPGKQRYRGVAFVHELLELRARLRGRIGKLLLQSAEEIAGPLPGVLVVALLGLNGRCGHRRLQALELQFLADPLQLPLQPIRAHVLPDETDQKREYDGHGED